MNVEDYTNGISNINVREYIEEAIKSYNSGSYRASITYIWLSVFMDINQKIEQLSVLGEPEAIKIIKEIEKIREINNIPEMLVFEKSILNTAKDKFNLFDDVVMIDLKRIQEDRNRCVHPLLSYEGTLYKPTAEQARTHIINAYNLLLNEPNVYGKSAITRLFELIYSKIFPVVYSKAKIVLDSSYLKSPKESLLRNFTIALLKEYIKEPLDFHQKFGIQNTFKYLFEYNRGKIENVITDKLPTIINFPNDDELIKLLELMNIDTFFYNTLDEAKKILVKNFIENCPSGNLDLLNDLMKIPEIRKTAKRRILRTDRKECIKYISEVPFMVPKIIREVIIKRYIGSDSFDEANSFASVVIHSIPDMEKEEMIAIIEGIANNRQISNSIQVENVLRKILSTKKFNETEFQSILDDNHLKKKILIF